MNRLLPVAGAMACLFDMGFQEDGEFLRFPEGGNLDSLENVHKQLTTERNRLTTAAAPVAAPQLPGTSSTTNTQPAQKNNVPVPDMFVKEATFFGKLNSSFQHVQVYEDRVLQAKARSCIPVEELTKKAKAKLESLKSSSADSPDKNGLPTLRELLLLELINWFKTAFFTWMNAPSCSVCSAKTVNQGMAEPSSEELKYGASRVESYVCPQCSNRERFPRYNDPGKLLETRTGRCGEWANCFTLCCRALDFEARYVLDWTDHVWTEVYSESMQKWLHCDPCENICDKPLVYEVGWGKKLTYVIAFSKDDIQDVTARYTRDQQAILARRNECRESWLTNTIAKMRTERQKSLSKERFDVLQKRTIAELVEFMSKKVIKEGEDIGRQSGSLGWRLSRGETGGAVPKPHTFQLTPVEVEKKQFHLKYSCAQDKYLRLSDNDSEIKGWQNGTFEVKDVFRKEENDWKMVYLARSEGTKFGSVTWKLDVSDTNLTMDMVKIQINCETFETGSINLSMCGDENCYVVPKNKEIIIKDVEGCKWLTVTARLSGSRGDNAWQHAQLFRQSTDDNIFPLEMEIQFK